MVTKEKKYLKDKVANIIFTDKATIGFVENIVSKALEIPKELIKDNLTLLTPRINSNIHTQYSEVDAIYESNTALINIEINYTNYETLDVKNMKYICQLLLKQTKINEEYPKLKRIYQININNYDVFKEGKFIYRSYLMEETLHKKRNDFITIVDINVDFLRNLDYTKIMEEEDSLERLLYIFVCDDDNILDKLYLEDEIMKKVRDKLSALTNDFDSELYYDRQALINGYSYEEGLKDGVNNRNIEIASSMLEDGIPIKTIIKYTGLTKEELENLK